MTDHGNQIGFEDSILATVLYHPEQVQFLLPPDFRRESFKTNNSQLMFDAIMEDFEKHSAVDLIRIGKTAPELVPLIQHILAAPSFNGDFPEMVDLLQRGETISEAQRTKPANWEEGAALVGSISWACEPWLPNGLISMVVSEPGEGKSNVALRICAPYLTGATWHNGTPSTQRGSVLWCEAESGQGMNISRAAAWGLPLHKMYTPLPDPMADFSLDNPDHLEALRGRSMRSDVRLVVIDSLSGASRGDENTTVMLVAMKALAEICRDSGKPFLVLHHLNKSLDTGDGVHTRRVRGSSSIIQLARVVWAIDKPDESDPEHRRLSCIKNNLSKFPEPIGFRITDNGVVFGEAPRKPVNQGAVERAKEFLLVKLQAGAKPSQEIYTEADQAQISRASINRARDLMGIMKIRSSSGEWRMSLPSRRSEQDE